MRKSIIILFPAIAVVFLCGTGRAENVQFKTSIAIVSCITSANGSFSCKEPYAPYSNANVPLDAGGGGSYATSSSTGGYTFSADININKVANLTTKAITYLFDIGVVSMKTGDPNSQLMSTALVQVATSVNNLNEVTFSGEMIGANNHVYFPEFTIAPESVTSSFAPHLESRLLLQKLIRR